MRIVQPLMPHIVTPWPVSLAAAACLVLQVSPPSVETDTVNGWGVLPPLPLCWPLLRNSGLQMYTRPKNGLDETLSAHICSLSSNAVWPAVGLTSTGAFQLLLSRTLAGVGLSSRETPTPR